MALLAVASPITGAIVLTAASAAFLSPIGWAIFGLHLAVNIGVQIYLHRKAFAEVFRPLKAGSRKERALEVLSKAGKFAKLVFVDVLLTSIATSLFTNFILNKVRTFMRPAKSALAQVLLAKDDKPERIEELNEIKTLANEMINHPASTDEARKAQVVALADKINGAKFYKDQFSPMLASLQNAVGTLQRSNSTGDLLVAMRSQKQIEVAKAPQQALISWPDAILTITNRAGIIFDQNIAVGDPSLERMSDSTLAAGVVAFVNPGPGSRRASSDSLVLSPVPDQEAVPTLSLVQSQNEPPQPKQ
jgi:hypothetical protein